MHQVQQQKNSKQFFRLARFLSWKWKSTKAKDPKCAPSHQSSMCSLDRMDRPSSRKVCSAKIEFFISRLTFWQLFLGGSCCIASVNGPLEVSPANLDMNKAYVEVIYRPKSGLPGVNERYKEKIVKSLCETSIVTQLYPRTQITVQTQEMDDHGGVSCRY